jgi:ribose transport system ATP-binding protein
MPTDQSVTPALEVTGLRKVYGGEIALADASMRVGRGEIHGLLGANGAGKSTLVRIVSGVETQDGGTVSLGGTELPVPHTAAMARELGLAHIHQDRALVGDLSVAENMALTMGFPTGRGGFIDFKRMRAQSLDALRRVGLEQDVDTFVADLPIADQTLVAIARALAVDAKVILLDEPTANLGAEDSKLLYERLRALAADGVACVLITHALAEAVQVCDHVTVLRDGTVAASRPTAELTEHDLTTLVVGHTVTVTGPRAARNGSGPDLGEVVFELDAVRCERLGPLSLQLHAGEVVGITGLADSGHLLVGEMLSGMEGLDSGRMLLKGDDYAPRRPADARARDVACLPPDRLRDGLAVQMSARENLFFDGKAVGTELGIPLRREQGAAAELLVKGAVRPPDPEAIISTLSGGNMQKLLMAKWLAVDPRVLVLCEPTVGVDVGAREEIYEQLREAAARGVAILLASSDFEEVAALSDRIVVIRYGSVVAEVPAGEATTARLAALSSGANGGTKS